MKKISPVQKVIYSLIIISGFLLSFYLHKVLGWFSIDLKAFYPENRFLYFTVNKVVILLPALAATFFVFGKSSLTNLGLNSSIPKGFLYALLLSLPMLIGYAFTMSFNSDLSLYKVYSNALWAGLFEELLFRAVLFGLLFRFLGWGFIPASLLSALIFGSGHLYQAHDLVSALGVFGVTAFGGLWFGWLYIESNNNLWLVIFLHALMNYAWMQFTVDSSAMGGVSANVLRLMTIIFSILLMIYRRYRLNEERQITKKRLFLSA